MSFALAHQNKAAKVDKTTTPAKNTPSPLPIINSSRNSPDEYFLHMQRTIGNHAVRGLLRSDNDGDKGSEFLRIGIQPKLSISQPGDENEKEADRVADQVMRMGPSDNKITRDDQIEVYRKCAACEMKKAEEDKMMTIIRKPSLPSSSGLEASDETTNEINNIRSSGGHSIDASTRGFMESRFGYDFDSVRIHTDESAVGAANSVNPRTYAIGNDMVFGKGQYEPHTSEGRRLLAHGLTHVIQQSKNSGDNSEFETTMKRSYRSIAIHSNQEAQNTSGNLAPTGTAKPTSANGSSPSVLRAWTDADSRSYPSPKDPKQPATPPGGWNAGNSKIGGVERIPLEGLLQGLQAVSTGSKTKKSSKEASGSDESIENEIGKAIAIVPIALKPNETVEIFLHLHGHNIGYRQRSKAKDGMMAGSVRDVATDRIEQQIDASGRNMIGILPQGTTMSGFGAFDANAYVKEVWDQLVALGKIPKDAKRGMIVLSGHSGAASPINQMLNKNTLPSGLAELVLFDAIHAGQRPAVQNFLTTRIKNDIDVLKEIADPAHNGGLEKAEVDKRQRTYLSNSFRFRGIYTPKYHPQKTGPDGKPLWQDPDTKKKPVLDESAWMGYGMEYEPLRDFIKSWIDNNTKGLESSIVELLGKNYQVIPAGGGATHNTIMGANSNLQNVLGALPAGTSVPATGPPPNSTKTGVLERSSTPDTVMTSRNPQGLRFHLHDGPLTNTFVPSVHPALDSSYLDNRIHSLVVQRQPAHATAPLTDEQQWDQDWTAYSGQQHYFVGNDRPKGTPRYRYDVLCPLYKAHGIPRPMVYFATSITTASFYNFSTPAHTRLAAALATAESTLRSKGYATAPVTSLWALNPRTTSTGAWSNHADGRAVDIDPDNNPHIRSSHELKIISLVTGSDMNKGGQGYAKMKDASDRFKADYNLTGLQRRIHELQAVEQEKEAERDASRTHRDQLKASQITLTTTQSTLKHQLQFQLQSGKPTPPDMADISTLKSTIQQNDDELKQILKDLNSAQDDLKKKEIILRDATKDRKTLEGENVKFNATEKSLSELEQATTLLVEEIANLEKQISDLKEAEIDASNAKDLASRKAKQDARAELQLLLKRKNAELKKKLAELAKKKTSRDTDPLHKYAASGFLNLSQDIVDALVDAGLSWGGEWEGAKDFMHFEL